MADVTVATGRIGSGVITLSPNAVQVVNFADNISDVEVISDGTADVWYSLDGSTPTVGGANCYRLPAGATAVDHRQTSNDASTTTLDSVRFISTGTPVVSVQRGD